MNLLSAELLSFDFKDEELRLCGRNLILINMIIDESHRLVIGIILTLILISFEYEFPK